MYSYEDRLRAVRLYIRLGERVGLTIRQIGYPTKNALKGWHREFERSQDLPAGYARRPKYTHAHQEQAVQHYLDNGHCQEERSFCSHWKRSLFPGLIGWGSFETPMCFLMTVAITSRPDPGGSTQ